MDVLGSVESVARVIAHRTSDIGGRLERLPTRLQANDRVGVLGAAHVGDSQLLSWHLGVPVAETVVKRHAGGSCQMCKENNCCRYIYLLT
jgi:ATPase subunit of ABC transporter with duplicated ATPase domains